MQKSGNQADTKIKKNIDYRDGFLAERSKEIKKGVNQGPENQKNNECPTQYYWSKRNKI